MKVLFNGLPTKIDVDKIIDRYGVPAEGQLIPYQDIADLISVRVDTGRFRTVTTAWRKRLFREYNVLVNVKTGEGFYRANDTDRVETASHKVTSGKKSIMKGSVIASTTDKTRLDDETRKVCDHLSVLPARLRLMELVSAKPLPAME